MIILFYVFFSTTKNKQQPPQQQTKNMFYKTKTNLGTVTIDNRGEHLYTIIATTTATAIAITP